VTQTKTRLGAGGRIVLPAEFRKAMGVEPGDELVVVLEEDGVRLLTPRQAVLRAQALVRRHVPPGASLAKELIRERHKEARRG